MNIHITALHCPAMRSLVVLRILVGCVVVMGTAGMGVAEAEVGPPGRKLVKSGKVAVGKCTEPPLIDGGVPLPRGYLKAIMGCLNRTWSAHLKRTGQRFRPPVVRFYDRPRERVCGGIKWPVGAAAFYCVDRATVVFPLFGPWLEGRTDLYPMATAAHEYGHHLQSLTDIRAHYEKTAHASRSSARRAELRRRYELQADCLSGVFLGAVRRSLSRTAEDWEALTDMVRASGDDPSYRSHGSGANRVRWFTKGLRTRSPAACDTWSAPASQVS